MNPSELQRLLIAPEIIVVDLALAALRALDRALLAEHPLLHAPPDPADSLVQRRARHVLRRASRLRRALRDYRDVVDDLLADADRRDDPF
jgi:hypothetical protein